VWYNESMAKIPLWLGEGRGGAASANRRIVAYAAVDDEFAAELEEMGRWDFYMPRGKKSSYARLRLSGRGAGEVRMHQAVWRMAGYELPDEMQIDHIDRDGLNNKISNLRLVTHSGNQLNRSLANGAIRKNRTGVAGVSRSKKRWSVQVATGSGSEYIGHYPDFETAVRQRDWVMLQIHGDRAKTHYPREEYPELE
jgi:HNH endonuclease